jgi:hypothetical protein
MTISEEPRVAVSDTFARCLSILGSLACWLALSYFGMEGAQAAIPSTERAVLLNLYGYTDGIHWDPQYQGGWNGPPGTECAWYGITCDATDSTVIGINLAGVGMNGALPALTALTNLQTFDIEQTASEGIGAYNSLYGPIPPLSGLTHLQTFIANNTYFDGSIPSLAGLAELKDFEVYTYGFSSLGGSIPSLSGLTNLARFDVHGDGLTGPIPSLTGLYNLAYFRVGGNHLTGSIPDLSGLDALNYFDVSANYLTGNVPNLIDLPNLQHFLAYGNLLDGTFGEWSDLPQLLEFNAEYTRLTGGLPALVQAPNIQRFVAGPSGLTGNIPDISQLTNLVVFGVAGNQLTGPPPSPPASLVNARVNATGGGALCPNLLTPASDPPSAIDTDWNTATGTTPWSLKCAPDPKWPSFVQASSSRNPSVFGQAVTFTVLVNGMNPTGTVTFTSLPEVPGNAGQTTTLCDAVPLNDQIATCTVDNFDAGTSNVIVASYSGDANNAPSNNVIGTIFGNVSISTVDQLVYQSVTESATVNPVQTGQPVDLTASIAGGKPGDTVTFYDGRATLCANVPVVVEQDHQVVRCTTQFSTTGPHPLMVGYVNTGVGGASDPLIMNVVSAAAFDSDQFALTGSWYNPPTSGQGLEIEVYPDLSGTGTGFLFGGWFTNDAQGNPQWYTLQGSLAASHGASYSLAIAESTGGNFNAPPITQAVADGTATLTFYDCSHAALAYKFNDGRNGTIPFVRLTPATGCSSSVPAGNIAPPPNYADVLHSGAWYDPATSGQGLMIDIVPSINTFFAAWYTYAPQSEAQTGAASQRWFTLQDNAYTPGALNLNNVPIIATSGGVFNQPSNVATTQVGTANIAFTSCMTMTLTYNFTQGEFSGQSGTIHERAIVPLAGCQ